MGYDGFGGTLSAICNELNQLHANIQKLNSVDTSKLNDHEWTRLEYAKCKLIITVYQVYLSVNGMGETTKLDRDLKKVNRYANTLADLSVKEKRPMELDRISASRMIKFHI